MLTRVLQIQIDFTTKVEDFVAHNGPKFSYTKVALSKEFFVKSHNLLFEQGIKDIEINVELWKGVPCFFFQGKTSDLPFDIFSASFYLISRYEEYQPHIKDKHSRFKYSDSLAFKNGFLEKPIIDIWAYLFFEQLKERFPNFNYQSRKYCYISTLSVNNAYAYKHKSFVRTIGGFLKDLYKIKIISIWDRLTVLLNLKTDPFDTFKNIIDLKNKHEIKTIFFFLIGDYTTFDNNVSASKTKFKLLIKDMVDYAEVGLLSSYYTANDIDALKKEKERLESITNIHVKRSRQHYLRFSLPETYQKLIDLEFEEDYSMGYTNKIGFRASTCTPFYFYDLDFEIQTPLKIFPFAFMDSTLNHHMKLSPKQALGKIRDLKNEVKKVNGVFISLFHNESLSGYKNWKGWSRLYGSMLKISKQQ
ncbi:MAG: polysaccharide deacetylase family protein [Tenacibaculum sp.]